MFGSKNKDLAAKVSNELLKLLQQVATDEDRSRSYVVNNLLIKGLLVYKKTGDLLTGQDEVELKELLHKRKTTGLKPLPNGQTRKFDLEETDITKVSKDEKKRKTG